MAEDAFLEGLRDAVRAGAAGVAVGRQVFQAPDPAAAAHRIADVLFGSDRPVPLEAAR
jgi:DhnA family fructose-bisphosphate aldolase class Ia